jgi:serine/threonine-protein kinase
VSSIVDRTQAPSIPAPLSPPEAYFQQVVRCMLEKDVGRRPYDLSAPLYHFAMLARALEPPPPRATRIDDTRLRIGQLDLSIIVGDIATAKADAIVSSANYKLEMRSGVGDALRRRGGDEIEHEAQKGGEQPLGTCLRTKPGSLDTHHVFHAVSAWNEVSCVGRAFARALLLSEEHGCLSIAAPALGTGAARVGLEMCAHAMMTTLRWHLMLGGSRLREITIWVDSSVKRSAFQDVAEEVFGLGAAIGLDTVDVGLPVVGAASPEGATFLDPRLHSTVGR